MPRTDEGLLARYRVTAGEKFRLRDCDPGDTGGLSADFKDEAKVRLQRGVEELAELQDKLYAQDRWALLVVFQAMDAAGKDGTIKHVLSGVNPQGCQVHSFKAPSPEELDHDFLWRSTIRLPERGRIGVFNRSYYEEVLVVRVHRELFERQRLPARLLSRDVWEQRYADINAFEHYLARNGTAVLKFFLHVSKAEQRKRFLDRLEEPEKNWKFSPADVEERVHWNAYHAAYDAMIRATASKHAPWFVVPADNKWFTRMVVVEAVIDTLRSLDLRYPKLDDERRKAIETARRTLLAEKKKR